MARPAASTRLRFRWVAEDSPAGGWLSLFERAWPSYRAWFLREGEDARPGVALSRAKLTEFMPELVPTWERLIGLVAGNVPDEADVELAARLLSLYRPPKFLAACSQAVWTRGSPILLRNYDYDPLAFEGTVMRTRWGDRRVMATSDCLWGALDGINEHGLAIALAFGGRREAGDGFGIPLIMRYVLEVAESVADAIAVLRRVPSHMAYNVSLLDRSGAHAVAHLRPGHRTRTVRDTVCTNHQPGGARSPYARATRSRERKLLLSRTLRDASTTAEGLASRFLEAPLYMTAHDRGYGTLYTVAYRPEVREAEWMWPDARVLQSMDGFTERALDVALG